MNAAAARLAQLRVETAGALADIDALRDEWEALEARTPEATGFQSFAWCRCWLAAASEFGASCEPRVLTVRENDRLVMLWPLQIECFFGARVARWIGEPMTQYGDALAEAGAGRARWGTAARAELARCRDVDLFAFSRVREDGVLGRGASGAGLHGETLSAPFVDLAGAGWARRHKSLERRARRLAALGAPRLEQVLEPSRRQALAREALAMKRDWLRGKGFVSAGLTNPATAGFLDGLARDGFLRVNCLWVGETVAAIDLGFVGDGAYRSLLGSYNARFAEGSPGQFLIARLIERCAAEGLERFDLLAPADAYKLTWGTGAVLVGANFVPRTLRGHVAAFALARLRPLAKRLMRVLSAWRRTPRLDSVESGRAAPAPASAREPASA